jgi:BirA family biotin operon repressor/biotin-[acetyl-CoA-carboxylase] ligase
VSPTPTAPPASIARYAAPPLAAAAIERWLEDSGTNAPIEVEVVAETGSTNEDLLVRCRREQPPAPVLRAADHQTEGRGRRRRLWIAPPRAALLFSLAVPLHSLSAALPAITLASGVALAEVLQRRGVPVTLKWPNDLMYQGRKLGGILCELAVDPGGRATLVIGVGLNGWLDADARAAIGQPAAALTDVVAPALLAAEREAWIAQMAAALRAAAGNCLSDGFAPVRDRYNALLQSRGDLVDVVDQGEVLASGRVLEVDTHGRLLLATDTGTRAISVGDVSLRGASVP